MPIRMNEFRMPRYREIPDVGLYLDQTVKYINRFLEPLSMEITASMVSNYVKKGYISNPVRKQYNAEQIARLFFIAIVKSAISMDNIGQLFEMQRRSYELPCAYDFFCDELEAVLAYTFDLREALPPIGDQPTVPKQMLCSVITAISNIIYLSSCFERIQYSGEMGQLQFPVLTAQCRIE